MTLADSQSEDLEPSSIHLKMHSASGGETCSSCLYYAESQEIYGYCWQMEACNGWSCEWWEARRD
jgi:hypothetical protein